MKHRSIIALEFQNQKQKTNTSVQIKPSTIVVSLEGKHVADLFLREEEKHREEKQFAWLGGWWGQG